MAGGTKYHAHFVPDDELTADLYETACERLKPRVCGNTRSPTSPGRDRSRATISNTGHASRTWDLAWMRTPCCRARSRRGKPCDSLRRTRCEDYRGRGQLQSNCSFAGRPLWKETFFLGLRLNRGVDLKEVARKFGERSRCFGETDFRVCGSGLLEREGDVIRLTHAWKAAVRTKCSNDSLISCRADSLPRASEAVLTDSARVSKFHEGTQQVKPAEQSVRPAARLSGGNFPSELALCSNPMFALGRAMRR